MFVLDGKTVKNPQKRLAPLRGRSGGVIGGRALVALSLREGLVVALRADPDGDAHEVRFLPDLLSDLRRSSSRPRLFVGDRAMCYVSRALEMGRAPDAFVVRRRVNVPFLRDASRRLRRGRDPQGRGFVEEWGWLSTNGAARSLDVRQITLRLSHRDTLILVTNLRDRRRVPARVLLQLYRCRWRIETVFQDVTQVFGLKHLIGSSPQASVFQLSFCLLLYNLLQTLRAGIAAAHRRPVEKLSAILLFREFRRQLIGWAVLIGAAPTIHACRRPLPPDSLRRRLRTLLAPLWTHRWLKSPPQTRHPRPPPQSQREHLSAFGILQAAKLTTRQKRAARRCLQ